MWYNLLVATMTRKDQVEWMEKWARKNRVRLDLNGEVGHGWECVCITLKHRHIEYPEGAWEPSRAFRAKRYLAVMDQDDESISQLYKWLRWFDDHGYTMEIIRERLPRHGIRWFFAQRTVVARMTKSVAKKSSWKDHLVWNRANRRVPCESDML